MPHEVVDEFQGRRVRPVQVVEDHDEPRAPDAAQCVRGGLVEAETVPVPRLARGLGPSPQRRKELPQRREHPEHALVEVGERVGERLERAVPFELCSPAAQHGRPAAAGEGTELRQQPALADTGLTSDIDEGRTTGSHVLQGRIEPAELG